VPDIALCETKGKVRWEVSISLQQVQKNAIATAGAKELQFFSDQCVAQNKDQFLAFMFYFVVQTTKITSITHILARTARQQNP